MFEEHKIIMRFISFCKVTRSLLIVCLVSSCSGVFNNFRFTISDKDFRKEYRAQRKKEKREIPVYYSSDNLLFPSHYKIVSRLKITGNDFTSYEELVTMLSEWGGYMGVHAILIYKESNVTRTKTTPLHALLNVEGVEYDAVKIKAYGILLNN